MSMASLMFVAAVAHAGLPHLPESTIERGGVTFDFASISEHRFASAFDPGKNILKNPPSGTLTAPKTYDFTLPHTNGGVWRVSCRYRIRHEKMNAANFAVRPGGSSSYAIPECPISWGVLSDVAKVTCGEDRISVTFGIYAGGTFEFRDMSIVDETPKDPVVIQLSVIDLLDRTFAVSEGQAGILQMYWRKTDKKKAYAPEGFSAEVLLPPGIAFAGAAYADENTVKTEMRPDGSSVTRFRVSSRAPRPGDSFANWSPLATAVKAVRGVGTCGKGRISISYDRDGNRFCCSSSDVSFVIVPCISAKRPRVYANGIKSGGDAVGAFKGEAREDVAALMGDCGVSWIANGGGGDTVDAWRRHGIRHITPEVWPVGNGFMVGVAARIPAEDRFVAVDPKTGSPIEMRGAVCPVTIYEGSDFFRNDTVPMITRQLKGATGAWSNWEPGMFEQRGCMCDRCCRRFAEYMQKPYDEVKSAWPRCIMKGGVWHKEVKKFRSLEHAKVIHALDKVVTAASGGSDSDGFIPGIAWIQMSRWWRPRNYTPETQAIDYAGEMKWMCPWGPYVAWEAAHPYVYAKRKPLCHFFAAKEMRETVDADYPLPRRPKLMAFPQGAQCAHWITQPEHIGMALDSYFFNGFEASVIYFFPDGYDARYWERFADATTRAAAYENYVLNGRRVDASVKISAVGPYAANVKHLSSFLPEVTDKSPLQAVSYRLGNRQIVAVFNFWQKGEAFFNLKVSGLKGDVAVVDENGVLWAGSDESRLRCGDDLAEVGVDLVVPAARCRVFEFRADGDVSGAKSVFDEKAFQRLLERRRGDLNRAAEEDAAAEKAEGPSAPDYYPVI